MKTTLPGIWGVVLGLWCCNIQTHFQALFSAYSYIGTYICILLPNSPSPSNQSIDMILWTSGRALGGDVFVHFRSRENIPYKHRCDCLAGSPAELPELPPLELLDCRRSSTAGAAGLQELWRRSGRSAPGVRWGSFGAVQQLFSPPCRDSI